MAKKMQPRLVKDLARATGHTVDETLLLLWTNNLWEPDSGNYLLADKELKDAQRILNAPTVKEETKVDYWLRKLDINRSEFYDLLLEMGIKLEPNARKLPKNAFSKLQRKFPSPKPNNDEIEEVSQASNEDDLIQAPYWPMSSVESSSFKYISVEQVLEIYRQLSLDYEESDDPVATAGLIDLNLVSSAVENPKIAYQKYHTIELAVAATIFSLIRNHPFPNGNKRTALIAMLVMLDENGFRLHEKVDDSKLFKFVYDIAGSQLLEFSREKYMNLWEHEILRIKDWVTSSKTTKEETRVRPLPWRVLRQKLEELECQISDNTKGGEIVITRTIPNKGFLTRNDALKFKVKVSLDGTDIDKGVIQTLRKQLLLDDRNGVPTSVFFSRYPTLPSEFIQNHSRLIKRLSKF
jgi:death-on-curing family protein